MNEAVKQLLRNKLVPAIASVLMGVAVLIARRAALDVMVIIFGGFVIAGALGFIGMYFFGPYRDLSALFGGLLGILVGILIIIYADAVVDFFPTMMGIFLILNGLSNVAGAAANGEDRILIGLMAVLVIAFGVLILMQPGVIAEAITIYIGISLILNGVFDLVMLYRIKDAIT